MDQDQTAVAAPPSAGPVEFSATIAHLAGALAKAQATIEGATKDTENGHFKSRYADLASVWNACRAPLSANGLAVLQPATADGAKVTVVTLLAHASGEWIRCALTATAQQNTPQGIGSCITYLRRYGLASMVGVAPEDDDGEAAEGRSTQGSDRRSNSPPITGRASAPPAVAKGSGPRVLSAEESAKFDAPPNGSLTAAVDAAPTLDALNALIPQIKALPAAEQEKIRAAFAKRKKSLDSNGAAVQP